MKHKTRPMVRHRRRKRSWGLPLLRRLRGPALRWLYRGRGVAVVATIVIATMGLLGVAADAAYEPLSEELSAASWLRVRNFKISGNRGVSRESIVECVVNARGVNIFLVNPVELENALRELPRIKEAWVSRNFLGGTIHIRVEERVPLALVLCAGGLAEEIDAAGVRLPICEDCVPRDLVFITGAEVGGQAAISTATEILTALNRVGLAVILSEIDVSDPLHPIGIAVQSGTIIRFSSRYPAENQVDHLAVVLDTLGEEQIVAASIDLRFPGRAEVLPRAERDTAPEESQERG